MIFGKINKELLNQLELKQWNNSTAVFNWFKIAGNNKKYERILLFNKEKTIRGWHQIHVAIRANKIRKLQDHPTRKKITTLQQGNSLAKELHQPFWSSHKRIRWSSLWTSRLVFFK